MLPVVLYLRETWAFTWERTKAEVFEKRELCTIFGSKREIVTGDYRIMIGFMASLPG